MPTKIELKIIIETDGHAWCAHYDDFKNLQESPAGFGDSTFEALIKLICNPEGVSKF